MLGLVQVAPGFEEPVVYWVPAIAVSGLSFYSGDKFPAWKGNAFVGAMRNNTGQHIQRRQQLLAPQFTSTGAPAATLAWNQLAPNPFFGLPGVTGSVSTSKTIAIKAPPAKKKHH